MQTAAILLVLLATLLVCGNSYEFQRRQTTSKKDRAAIVGDPASEAARVQQNALEEQAKSNKEMELGRLKQEEEMGPYDPRTKLTREERKALRQAARARGVDLKTYYEPLQQYHNAGHTDLSKCYTQGSTFCRGLLYNYAEFIACVVRNKDRFTGEFEGCRDSFAEEWSDCAPDLIRICPKKPSTETTACLLAEENRHLVSKACIESDVFGSMVDNDIRLLTHEDMQGYITEEDRNDEAALKAKQKELMKNMQSGKPFKIGNKVFKYPKGFQMNEELTKHANSQLAEREFAERS